MSLEYKLSEGCGEAGSKVGDEHMNMRKQNRCPPHQVTERLEPARYLLALLYILSYLIIIGGNSHLLRRC